MNAAVLRAVAAISCAIIASAHLDRHDEVVDVDVVVYAATPAGVSSAIAIASVNPSLKVVLMEPSAYVGGMASPGGIGLRDQQVGFADIFRCCVDMS